MSSVKVYSAVFSTRLREGTAAFSYFFIPQALGSSSVSGPLFVLCNPNPFYLQSLSYLSSLPFWVRVEILCNPKSGQPPLPMPSCIDASLAQLNLNIIVEVSLLYQYFFAIMVGLALSHSLKFDGYNRQRQTIRKNGTQNRRPFKWPLGYRTYIPNFSSPFFRGKDWAFFYEKSRGPSGGQ